MYFEIDLAFTPPCVHGIVRIIATLEYFFSVDVKGFVPIAEVVAANVAVSPLQSVSDSRNLTRLQTVI